MKESKFIWFNGSMVPWQEAQVHVMAHALHYGSSVFEGLRCYETSSGPALFRLEAHTKRLMNSAKMYRMPIKFTEDELNAAQVELIRQNELRSAYVRPLIFRGPGSIAVAPGDACPIEVVIAAFEMGAYLGKEGLENGIDTCVSSWQRIGSATNPALSKAGGHYLNAYLVGEEARRNGFDEGISVNARGLISEGSAENLFLIQDGVIYTPPLSAAILGGITRSAAMTLAQDLGYQIIERDMPRELLYSADEIFLTGTAAEVTPVRTVDRLPVGEGRPGPITKSIQQAFFGLFDGSTEDKWNWLTVV